MAGRGALVETGQMRAQALVWVGGWVWVAGRWSLAVGMRGAVDRPTQHPLGGGRRVVVALGCQWLCGQAPVAAAAAAVVTVAATAVPAVVAAKVMLVAAARVVGVGMGVEGAGVGVGVGRDRLGLQYERK